MIKNNKKRLIIILLILSFFFQACKLNISNSNPITTDSTESDKILNTTPTATRNRIVDNTIDILFIGNSITYVGGLPRKLQSLLDKTDKDVNILEKLDGGYKLSEHLNDFSSGVNNDLIDKADYVIFQEFGSNYSVDTSNSITKMQELFKLDTKFYFLLTEFDMPARLEKISEVGNITYIPVGYAHYKLLQNGFKYSQLHPKDDYHPNSLYGYLESLAVFSVLYNTSCIGLPYDFLDDDTISLIPGESKEEKDKSIKIIQETVMKAVNADIEEYRDIRAYFN